MKIMYVSSEVAPFSKAGGLGDVMGALPEFVEKNSDNVCAVFTPFYGSIDSEKYNIVDVPNSSLNLRFARAEFVFKLKMCRAQNSNTNIFFIVSKKYFTSFDEIYPQRVDPRYEQEKYVVFAKAVLEYAKLLNFKPDIIHLNDWHTAPLCAYVKNNYANDPFYKDAKVVFSIHNLAYQGNYFDDILDFAQLPKSLSSQGHDEKINEYKIVNWLKIAIKLSDKILTVSPRYAQEIQGSEFGCGLDGDLRLRKNDITGILNGLDLDVYNPKTDKFLIKNYDLITFENKSFSKKEICEKFNIKFDDKPLFAVIARLVEQKGYDLIIKAVEELKNLYANFVILGSGEKYYSDYFEKLNKCNTNIKACTKYSEKLARKLFAASDFLLMPSHFEPCGITQMIAMRYGSLPLVRAVGGLEDTIVGYPLNGATGFKFWRYEPKDMLICIKMAIDIFNDKKTYNALVKNAMSCDFSWNKSTKEYCECYNSVVTQSYSKR